MPTEPKDVLTEEDFKTVDAWVRERYTRCPNCGQRTIDRLEVVAFHMMEHVILDDGKPIITWNENRLYPAVPLKCTSCENITFFMAKDLLRSLGKM